MSNQPFLKMSVILPTFNRRAVLARTLPAVFDQDFPADGYEVIVVVDGSTDGTVEMLRGLKPSCRLQILEQSNRGQAAAKNAGAKVASGELILFLDDDILCDRGLLKEHVEAHRQGGRLLVFGPVFVAEGSGKTLATETIRHRTDAYFRELLRGREVRWPEDAYVPPNASLSRSAFLTNGGFDERFGRMREEIDLGLRLWEKGVRFRFLATAVGRQVYTKSEDDLIRYDAPWFGTNELLLCRKHPTYRCHSPLVLTRGPAWKRLLRQWILRLPISLEPLLRMPYWIANQLRAIPAVRRAGTRLLQLRMGVVSLRAAAREAGSARALWSEFGVRLPVLLYHRVGPPKSGTYPELTITPRQFCGEMKWLAERGYVGIRPSDWLAWRMEGKPLPGKPIILTFDDAYADFIEYALPILQRHGFGAAVFVVTGRVGGTNAWDEARGSGTLHLMTAEQIRHCASRGVELGAHSRTHADLKTLTPPRLEEEIRGSEKDLAEILRARAISFAYPYGAYNQAVRDAVRGVFELAFTTDRGFNDLQTDPHLLRRTMVYPWDSLIDFACRIHFGRAPLEAYRLRLARAIQRLCSHPLVRTAQGNQFGWTEKDTET